MGTCLACDIGASGGRVIAGTLARDRLTLNTIHRFDNEAIENGRALVWDVEYLERELLRGLRKAREQEFAPSAVGVDAWGVDYVLTDGAGRHLSDCVCYRDARTAGMPEQLALALPFSRHYALTGIAAQPFNTVYQLMSEPRKALERAEHVLMLPDFLHGRLTGRLANEYTAASTTGLLNARTGQWEREVLAAAGIPERLFMPVTMPGTALGDLKGEAAQAAGFDCPVILPPSHDTASAFLAAPAGADGVILSSGTWSLLGVELPEPLISPTPAGWRFTNEGGWGGGKRYLKNIMGLWILQCLRRELAGWYTFEDMARMAMAEEGYQGVFNANDPRLLLPEGMADTVRLLIAEYGNPPPRNDGQLFAAVMRSLAICYRDTISQLSRLTGRRFSHICVVGGGCGNITLNQWTADAVGLPVFAGPVECTSSGNILSQMMALGWVDSPASARRIVRDSFPIRRFDPR